VTSSATTSASTPVNRREQVAGVDASDEQVCFVVPLMLAGRSTVGPGAGKKKFEIETHFETNGNKSFNTLTHPRQLLSAVITAHFGTCSS
jgi:hypothetical protein